MLIHGGASGIGTSAILLASAFGAKVLTTAGSAEKCAACQALGAERAINYRTCGDLTKAVREALPDGIDVYFENVGGAHLDAALANMRQGGRIAVCGMIEQYNATSPQPGPANIINVIPLRLTIKGFIVTDFMDMMPDFMKVGAWV